VIGSAGQLSFSVLDVGGPVELASDSGKRIDAVPGPGARPAAPHPGGYGRAAGIAKSPSTGESALRTDWVLERLRA
jgi:hypothetical protein